MNQFHDMEIKVSFKINDKEYMLNCDLLKKDKFQDYNFLLYWNKMGNIIFSMLNNVRNGFPRRIKDYYYERGKIPKDRNPVRKKYREESKRCQEAIKIFRKYIGDPGSYRFDERNPFGTY